MTAEQIAEQKVHDAQAKIAKQDEVTKLSINGQSLNAQQRDIADLGDIQFAERRMKELARVRDGEEAAAQLAAAQRELATARQNHQAEVQKLLAEHGPKVRQCLTADEQLQQRKIVGDRSLMWLIEMAPPHVSEPLAHLRQVALREQQARDRNEAALASAKSRLKAAKAGELEFPSGMATNNGWANRDGDNRARRDRNRQYSRDMLQTIQGEIDHLQPIYDGSNQRVQDLRSKIARLEALLTEAWPTRAQVTEILGKPWEPQQAAKSPLGMYINPLLGTPAEARA